MACTIRDINGYPKLNQSLRNKVGSNDKLYAEYVSTALSEEFKEYCKDTLNFDLELDGDMRRVIPALERYYNFKHPSISNTAINKRNEMIGGFTSVDAREFGKRHIGSLLNDFFFQANIQGIGEQFTIKPDNSNRQEVFNNYKTAVKKRVFAEFKEKYNALQTIIKDKDGFKKIVEANKETPISGAIQVMQKYGNIQDVNIAALFSELNSNAEQFFSEVFRDSRLAPMKQEFRAEITELENSDEDSIDGNEEDSISQDDDSVDTYITTLNQKLGDYSSFIQHVDGYTRCYFNGLKRLNSTDKIEGKYDYDKSNELGVTDTMNNDECCLAMFTYGNFTSVDTMIDSVRLISNNLESFKGFTKFADDLSNDKDFANYIYTTFGKSIIGKLETLMEDNIGKTDISNKASDKRTQLTFDYLNSIKTSSIEIENVSADIIGKSIREKIDLYKGKSKTLEGASKIKDDDLYNSVLSQRNKIKLDIKNTLYDYIHRYYPTVTNGAIANYLENNEFNGQKDFIFNSNNLLTILDATIKGSYTTQLNYNSRQAEINQAFAANKKLLESGEYVNPNKLINVSNFYSNDYLSNSSKAAATELAKALENFELVKTSLNSRNVHGNNSSDVINNSMFTNIINTIKNDIALQNYGNYKFQGNQYDLSNILMETWDNGKIVNYGLFTYVEDKLVPTSYAKELLKITLYNGASDLAQNKNTTYSEMSKGDYVTSAFINFFNSSNIEIEENNIPTANYFSRIPSDAPKTFVIRAPKYSTKGLFKLTDQTKADIYLRDRIKELIDNKSITNDIAEENNYIQLFSNSVDIDTIINHINSKSLGNLYLSKSAKLNSKSAKNGDKVSITYSYQGENTPIDYVIEGTYIVKDGKRWIENAKFVGFIANYDEVTTYLPQDLRSKLEDIYLKNAIKSGEITQEIDKNHQVFKQFKNIFKQELTNAATAIDKFFIHNNGIVQLDNNNIPVFKNGYDNTNNTDRKIYALYHHAKGKHILEKDNRGRYKLTGKVFTSDRFELYDRKNNKVVNYLNSVIGENKAIDFLYGGDTFAPQIIPTSNGIKVQLSNEQEQAIDNAIANFITDYVADTTERIKDYESFIPENMRNEDNYRDFALNNHLMYNGFNDLLEGDSKFYKNTQDFLKRAKESQASGIPYGLTNYAEPLTDTRKEISSRLDNENIEVSFIDKLGNPQTRIVKQYNRFNAVTVKNTIRNSTAIDRLTKKLIANGIDKKAAEKMMQGYTNTTVNDAQSYITYEEWIRRTAAKGELKKYRKLIDAINNETKPIDAATLTEWVQVQKNFYYDQHYNSDLGIIVPRQIKNAEFVLIPRFIKGTELERVYNVMMENNIDQLNTEETSKAAKANVLTLWNNDGVITEDTWKDFNNNINNSIEEFNYNYLYKQQDTPQHMDASNKAGIQLMKKILDNIDKDSPIYKNKERLTKNYIANIRESFTNLMNEFNIELDKNGNIKLNEDGTLPSLNNKVFYDRLLEEAERLGVDSNMLDYLTLKDDIAETLMPNYMSNVSTKLESIAQAMFNSSITRQKLPGFHAAQVTNVGTSEDLRYHPEINGKVQPYIEVIIAKPIQLAHLTDTEALLAMQDAKIDEFIGYRIPTEGKQSLSIMKVISFLDNAQGSTIIVPDDWVAQTGADFDIDSIYTVTHEFYVDKNNKARKIKYSEGNTEEDNKHLYIRKINSLKLKGDLTSIELLSIAFENDNLEADFKQAELLAKKNNEINYKDFTNTPVEDRNTREARNNQITDDMLTILRSGLSLEENLSRSNFEDIINARDEVQNENVKNRRNNRSPYNFFDQADFQEDVMAGAKLKAFSVTRDTFASVCNTAKTMLNTNNIITAVYYKSDGYKKSELENRFGKDNVISSKVGEEKVYIVKHDKLGWSNDNKNVDDKLITAYSSQTTAHILDAVKEGAIPNVNDLTFGVYKTFPDVGINYNTGISFIMQPGITRIVDAYNRNKSIYNKGGNFNPIHTAIKEIAQELGLPVNNYSPIDVTLSELQKSYGEQIKGILNASEYFTLSAGMPNMNGVALDSHKLAARLNTKEIKENKVDNLLFDLSIIFHYNKLSLTAKQISDIARVTNPDKFGAKQSIYATNKVFYDIQTIIHDKNMRTGLYVEQDGKAVNLLEAIYPDIRSGLEEYIKSNNNDSVYPSLNAFLKYSTATSIKINQSLFRTEKQSFRNAINEIENYLEGNMTEKLYKDVKNYILSKVYTSVPIINNGITIIDGDFAVNTEINYEIERSRVYGYGKTPNIDFEVNDINFPTQEEINKFAELSPAQKIYWIQQTYRDSGVFKYLNVNLFNEYQYRKNRSSQQTIQYIDNTANIETVLNEFEKTFFNNNPLVKLATLDIIKYAAIVEGFVMKRNGISKIIKNNSLYTSIVDGGTNFVAESNDIINNVSTSNLENTYNNYIRSHSNIPQIHSYRNKKIKNIYEINTGKDYNIITFDITNNDDRTLALRSGFAREINNNASNLYVDINKYVKLTTGKKITLYSVINDGTQIYAYPLNLLEENENSNWSANTANNIYYDENFYASIIHESITKNQNIAIISNEFKEQAANYKFINENKVDKTQFVSEFDLNNPSNKHVGGFKAIVEHIEKTFNNIESPTSTWIRSMALTDYIPVNGTSIQIIDGKQYIIKRISMKDSAKAYLKTGKLGREIKELNLDKRAIIEKAREMGVISLNDVFNIMPYINQNVETEDNGIRYSSITEDPVVTLANNAIHNMRRKGSVDSDIEANKALRNLSEKGIDANNYDAIRNNQEEVIRVAASYVDNAVKYIKNNIDFFYTDKDGILHSINDKETIEYIKNNPVERERYIKTILDASTFGTNYKLIKDLDIDAQDNKVQPYLNKIKNAIQSLENSVTINNARERFFLEYLSDLSDNPLIQSDIITILDGFNNVDFFESYITDIQETSMPLIQIVMKEVMSNIRAKEFKAKDRVAEFNKQMSDIRLRAQQTGKGINFSNIIDENGRFIQSYSDKLLEDLANYRQALTDAKVNFGKGSYEYIMAKRAYDNWKLQHTNQVLLDDYYQRKLDIEGNILTNFKTIYTEYRKLEEERNEILNHVVNGELDEEYKNRLKAIKNEMDSLSSAGDNFGNPKLSTGEGGTPLNSLESSIALKNYIQNMKKLREEYFDKDIKFGFEEQLDRNLNIIKSYERRDSMGRLTVPIDILMQNDDYRKAKEWLNNNAVYYVQADLKTELDKAFATFKEPTKIVSSIINTLTRKLEAYDNLGVIDGNKFNDEDIRKIKEEQLTRYNINESVPYSDTSLIKSSPTDDTIYKSSFYKGMTSDGTNNADRIKIINDINKLLQPYYDTVNKTVETWNMNVDELKELRKLYDELDNTTGKKDVTNGKRIYNFIQSNVNFVTDERKYEFARVAAEQKGGIIYKAWLNANTEEELDESTNEVHIVPNRYIYGYAKPKDNVAEKYIDKDKTMAARVIANNVQFVPTQYYYDKLRSINLTTDEGKTWYSNNHIYNPYTHVIEPLKIWTKMQVIGRAEEGEWEARYNQMESSPNPLKLNPNYKDNVGTAQNYKTNTGYDRVNNANEFELEAKDYIQQVLSSLVSTDKAKKYIENGYLPSKAVGKEHDVAYYIKEFGKSFGIITDNRFNSNWSEDIDYSKDYTVDMPMLQQLANSSTRQLIPIRKRMENETDEEYNKYVADTKESNNKIKEDNAKIHKDLLSNNWDEVIQEFILQASHYNALQENKYLLFLGLQQLRNMKIYKSRLGIKNLLRDRKRSNENDIIYHTESPEYAIKLYENSVRRILYDQFKKPQGIYTKAGNILQSIASAKYMMFNITGGLANVMFGSTQIFMERFAKDYFNHTDWETGKSMWINSVPSFFANMYSERSYTIADGIIKLMNVVDFDAMNQVVSQVGVDETISRLRNAAFSPQSAGEHFMQNTAMFAMMNSHRVYTDNKGNIVTNSFEKYKRDCEEAALTSVIKDNPELLKQYEDYIKKIKTDANEAKDYAFFKRYVVNDFTNNYLSTEQQKEFIEKRKEFTKNAKSEFEQFPKLISQFDLKDGLASFKADSIFNKLSRDESYKILANFKGKVIATNKKIHGVYDKLGAARIESEWWGGLVMQYHKHLYPGFMKRYRRKGYFNEERQTIEKGSYNALFDFIATPIRKFMKDRNENEVEMMEGVQNLMKNIVNFSVNIKLNWQLLPDNERANIRRNLGDLLGVVSALFMAIGIKLADDDDEGFLYNLCLYQADRLASESMAYTIPGAMAEAEKLWSSPVAASGGIEDLLKSAGVASQILIQGNDYDPYYSTGLYAGEHKIGVMLSRQIPIYRSIDRVIKLEKSNKYYKLGDNVLSIVPVNDVVKWLED